MSGTAHTFTGGCCRAIRKSQRQVLADPLERRPVLTETRTWSCRRSPRSPRPSLRYLPHSWISSFKSCRRWRRYTTSSPSRSSAKDDSVPRRCRKPPSSALPLVANISVRMLTGHREQRQLARENPIAAAAAAAAVSGNSGPPPSNVENLLDIDFDGAAPASMQSQPPSGASGLEGLAGTPQRVASPTSAGPGPTNNMDDLMGLFGSGGAAAAPASAGTPGANGANDIMNGFATMDLGGGSQPPPPQQQQQQQKSSNDLLDLI